MKTFKHVFALESIDIEEQVLNTVETGNELDFNYLDEEVQNVEEAFEVSEDLVEEAIGLNVLHELATAEVEENGQLSEVSIEVLNQTVKRLERHFNIRVPHAKQSLAKENFVGNERLRKDVSLEALEKVKEVGKAAWETFIKFLKGIGEYVGKLLKKITQVVFSQERDLDELEKALKNYSSEGKKGEILVGNLPGSFPLLDNEITALKIIELIKTNQEGLSVAVNVTDAHKKVFRQITKLKTTEEISETTGTVIDSLQGNEIGSESKPLFGGVYITFNIVDGKLETSIERVNRDLHSDVTMERFSKDDISKIIKEVRANISQIKTLKENSEDVVNKLESLVDHLTEMNEAGSEKSLVGLQSLISSTSKIVKEIPAVNLAMVTNIIRLLSLQLK